MDSLRILEVLMSNHLELSSDRAAIEQERMAIKEFEAEGLISCMYTVEPPFKGHLGPLN